MMVLGDIMHWFNCSRPLLDTYDGCKDRFSTDTTAWRCICARLSTHMRHCRCSANQRSDSILVYTAEG